MELDMENAASIIDPFLLSWQYWLFVCLASVAF